MIPLPALPNRPAKMARPAPSKKPWVGHSSGVDPSLSVLRPRVGVLARDQIHFFLAVAISTGSAMAGLVRSEVHAGLSG